MLLHHLMMISASLSFTKHCMYKNESWCRREEQWGHHASCKLWNMQALIGQNPTCGQPLLSQVIADTHDSRVTWLDSKDKHILASVCLLHSLYRAHILFDFWQHKLVVNKVWPFFMTVFFFLYTSLIHHHSQHKHYSTQKTHWQAVGSHTAVTTVWCYVVGEWMINTESHTISHSLCKQH